MSEETITTDTNVQESIAEARKATKEHFAHHKKIPENPTISTLREDAKNAQKTIEKLHTILENTTSDEATADVMRIDQKNATQAHADITKGKDPLATYAGYSAYAVPQQNGPQTNSTYDKYIVKEDKNEVNIEYNSAELTPAGENDKTNTYFEEKSYSYNEKKSNGKTIITTEQTSKTNRTPAGYAIISPRETNNKEEGPTTFIDEHKNKYVYDENDKLTKQIHHSRAEASIHTSQSVAYDGQDLSKEQNPHTKTTIYALKASQSASFSHYEYTPEGKTKAITTAALKRDSETYTSRNSKQTIDVTYKKNKDGKWIYEGKISTTENGARKDQQLSPEQAKKQFDTMRNNVNKQINDLTGTNSMSEYRNQLGNPKSQQNQNAAQTATSQRPPQPEDIRKKYANTPATLVAMKKNLGR